MNGWWRKKISKKERYKGKKSTTAFLFRHRHLLSLLTQHYTALLWIYVVMLMTTTMTMMMQRMYEHYTFIFGNFHHLRRSVLFFLDFDFKCDENRKRKRNVLNVPSNSMTKLCVSEPPTAAAASPAAAAIIAYFFHCMASRDRDTRQIYMLYKCK